MPEDKAPGQAKVADYSAQAENKADLGYHATDRRADHDARCIRTHQPFQAGIDGNGDFRQVAADGKDHQADKKLG